MTGDLGPAGPNGHVPITATDAVLKPSDSVPEGAQKVRGIEFDDYDGRDITAKELVAGMTHMGFQASAVGDAVRIINDMVGSLDLKKHGQLMNRRKLGGILILEIRIPYSLVIRRI